MSGSFANEQLSAYLDGELDESEAAAFERELSRDPVLRRELEDLRAAVELMRTHGPAKAPADLYGSIVRAAEDEPMPGAWWRWLLRPFGIPIQGLAVAAVGLVVLVLAMNGGDLLGGSEPEEPTEEASAVARKDAPPAKGQAAGEAEALEDEEADAVADLGELEGQADEAPQVQSKKEAMPRPKEKTASKTAMKQALDAEPDALRGAAGGTGEAAEDGAAGSKVAQTTTESAGTDADEPELSNRTVAYELDTTDPEALYKLKMLAGRHGGQIVGAGGKALSSYDLDQGSPQTLTVSIPRTRLADFVGDLKALGKLQQRANASSSEFFTADQASIELTVAFTGAAQEPAPESRKSRDAYEQEATGSERK